MKTPIYTSKKLEKLIKKLIRQPEPEEHAFGKLGGWNATVCYIDRKKCWLITNAKTRYSVVLTDIRASDLKNIEVIFKENLIQQLTFDRIKINPDALEQILGNLIFYPTNNDKKTLGFQNSHLYALEYRKYEYGSLQNMPMNEITHGLNTHPYYLGKKSLANLTNPVEQMSTILHDYSRHNNL